MNTTNAAQLAQLAFWDRQGAECFGLLELFRSKVGCLTMEAIICELNQTSKDMVAAFGHLPVPMAHAMFLSLGIQTYKRLRLERAAEAEQAV